MTTWFYPGQEDYITKLNELGAIAELTRGYNGWTPVFAAVQDGSRVVLKVTDWTGGTVAKPAINQYLASTGLTPNIALATDIRGAQGTTGAAGPNNTLSIGTVTSGASASATITGTSPNQTLNLVLPKGTDGTNGAAATISVGTVTTGAAGSSAAVTNAGTSSAAVLNFTIPKGDTGAQGVTGATGPSNTLSIGTVTSGASASATITGTSPSQTLNLVLPKGTDGTNGAAATISVGTVTTGAAGSSATVTNAGTSSAAVLNFTIPKGDTGAPGGVTSVSGKTGVVTLAKADVGLGNVDNTSDANKPISTATQTALDAKAPLTGEGATGNWNINAATTTKLATARTLTIGATGKSFDGSAALSWTVAEIGATPAAHAGAGGAAHADATTSVAGFMSAADKTKLNGVVAGATANSTDAQLRDRSTHTGTQAIATVDGLTAALNAKLSDAPSDGKTYGRKNAAWVEAGDVTTNGEQVLVSKIIHANENTLTVDGVNEVGFRHIPQNSQSTAYTLVLDDAGKHILHPAADTTARIFTIPANSAVAFPIGTAITFINQNGTGGVVTIAITTDTMRLAGAGTTGSRTLARNGIATAIKITATEWIISGTGLT